MQFLYLVSLCKYSHELIFSSFYIILLTSSILFQSIEDDVQHSSSLLEKMLLDKDDLSAYMSSTCAIPAQVDECLSKCTKMKTLTKQRLEQLTVALQERKEFYIKWDEFEMWLTSMKTELDKYLEIYSDEVTRVKDIHVQHKESSSSHAVPFKGLSDDVEELCKLCDDSGSVKLQENFNVLNQTYQQTVAIINDRIKLCDEWLDYSEYESATEHSYSTIESSLQRDDLSVEALQDLCCEMEELKSKTVCWQQRCVELDHLLNSARMTIKHRQSHRNIHFQSLIQTLLMSVDKLLHNIAQKQGKVHKISELWGQFESQCDSISETFSGLSSGVNECAVHEGTIKGVKTNVQHIKDYESDLKTSTTYIDQVHDLGNEIQVANPQRMQQVCKGFI